MRQVIPWLALLPTVALAEPKHELSVAAGVDSAYDDNVYNGRGPDYVNRIAPAASYRLITPRVRLEAGYTFGLWTYAFAKAENSFNHRGRIGLEAQVTRRLTVRVADEITRAEDPGYLLRTGVVAPQIGITFNTAEAGLEANLSRRVFIGAGYELNSATFDPYTAEQAAAFAPLYDGAEHRAAFSTGVRVTRADDFLLSGRYQHFSAGPQADSFSRWGLANTYSPTAGWRHRFTRHVEATADVGPLYYQALAEAANIPGAPQTSGWTWRLLARLRYYTPTWRGSLSYTRDLLGATGAGSALWADFVYGQVGYHLLEMLDVHAGAGYFRNGRAVDQPFAYDGVTTDVIIDWRVINNLRLGAYYTLRWQQTGPGAVPPGEPATAFPNITRNIVGVRLLAVIGADARPPRREVRE